MKALGFLLVKLSIACYQGTFSCRFQVAERQRSKFGWICTGISGGFDWNTQVMICCLLPLVFRSLDDPEVKTTVIRGVLVTRHSYRCLWWTVCDDLLSISPFVRMTWK